jgi:hypothetical protein
MYKTKIALTLIICLMLTAPLVVAQQEARPLTNADIVTLIKAAFPESTIVIAIQQSKSIFDTSPEALIQLKNQGATPKILEAMLQAKAGKAGGEKPSLVQATKEIEYKVEEELFIFEVKQCKKLGKKVVCELLVTNKDQDRGMWFRHPTYPPSTRMIDESGNEYKVDYIQFGGEKRFSSGTSFVTGVPVKATLVFEDVASEASKINLLEIYCTIATPGFVGKDFRTQIRNIPLKTGS